MVNPVASSLRYRWVILGVCWLAFVVALMQRLSVGPLVPFIKEGLNLTSAQAGFFMSAAAFGYMLTVVPAGWLVDRIGVRWLLLVGEIFGGIFIAGMFIVTTFTQGLIFMALAGMGMGCLTPSTTKAVLEWFPQRERATAMGFKQTAINIGGMITASILPTVALRFGWQFGFLGIGLAAMVIGIVSFLLYKPPQRSVIANALESNTTLAVRASVRDVFASRNIWLVIGGGMFLVVVDFSVVTYLVLYLKEVLLFPVVTAGFLLATFDGGGAFGKPLTGVISDYVFRGSRKNVYILMGGVTFVMSLVFAFIAPGTPLWLMIILAIIFGFAGFGWGGLHLTLIGEFAGKELAGTVTGISTVFIMAANIVGPPIFGYIVDATGSYKVAWQFLAVMAVLAVALLFFVQEEKKRI